MRKRWIILSVSLSVAAGSLAAYGVSRLTAARYADQATATAVTYAGESAETHFASATAESTTQRLLPDFTAAAEQGVEAVVNIENRQK